ncbi:MAG: TrkH family potassium uptake protein [Peptoniphilaceae bacterium]|nr:TrkH family potassium uptake protein [Peptoniphilaceae bacterium]
MEENIIVNKINKAKENPTFILAIGFLLLISLGGLILSTSFVTNTGERTGLIDSFFVAASASCVTGLTPVNTAMHWNFWGKLVILILIQIGGLGIMTLASIIPLILGRKIGIKSRAILKEQLNVNSMEGLVKLFKYVLAFTIITEGLGALALSFSFVPTYGVDKGIWFSIFHSISAFCNAGFDIMGDSIYPLRNNGLVNITLMALVIVGGLGFMVTSEIYYKRTFKNLSTHSKLVILVSIILLLLGAFGFFMIESFDGGVLEGEGLKGAIYQSLFQSVSARTAGFYSVNLSQIKDSSALFLMIFMFIGGSPGSTAGGLKTTTFVVLVLASISVIKKEREPVVFNRHIGEETIKKALAIFMISMSIVFLVSFILTLSEIFDLVDILYETVSALATVGASRGITGGLSNLGKILIGLCMYLGRVGPMSMAFAFGIKSNKRMTRYPESFISIG